VQAYLALMHSRLPRMSFGITVPAELKAARCPPLMLISLAENAVKHGVEPKIGLAEVRLEVSSPQPGRLRLAVMDNGVGFGESGSGSGLGLTNIRARLEQLYGEAAQLTLHARPAGGVVAALELPLEFAATADTTGDALSAAATPAHFTATP
jgi:LytS/YehU family sensor histidine kinase